MTNLRTINQKDLNDSQKQLIMQVDSIVKQIETGEYDFEASEDYEEPCASHYLNDVLDINYVVNRDKSYKGARILVAFGGPNIWIDTFTKEVQGYWGGDEYIKGYFGDELGLDDYCEEIYGY